MSFAMWQLSKNEHDKQLHNS